MRKKEEEVGDLFITHEQLIVKLLPSERTASMPIEWFLDGSVINHRRAAEDIAKLVGKLQGKSRVIRGLTLMTHHGPKLDLNKSGLSKAVEQAGYRLLN